MDNKDYLIEEYKTLREEIGKRQDARLVILGFTVTGTGTILGLTLGNSATVVQGLNYYSLALISFALALLIAALVMIIHHTQQIEVISSYIRKFIESSVSGLKWETCWTNYRARHRGCSPFHTSRPLGTSKPLAVYYGFMTVAIYSVTFVTGLNQYWQAIFPTALMIVSVFFVFDLYFHVTGGWRVDWNLADSVSISDTK